MDSPVVHRQAAVIPSPSAVVSSPLSGATTAVGATLDAAVVAYVNDATTANFETFYGALKNLLEPWGEAGEDICQTISLRVWQSVTNGQPPQEPVTWLSALIRVKSRDIAWREGQRKLAELAVAVQNQAEYQQDFVIEEEDARAKVLSQLTPQEQALCQWLAAHDGKVQRSMRGLENKATKVRRKVKRITDELTLAV